MTTLMSKALNTFKNTRPADFWQPVDVAVDHDLSVVNHAMKNGDFGTARLRFLRLAEQSQIRVLERIAENDATRLAGGLPTYTVARLYEHLSRERARAIAQALPEGKRQGLVVILNHRRRG
ncbi:hypothetical protein [Thioalkalivibrio sulfidiphilus]|uniref:hypothetical protein n=1 Tax=Thioalkalivibrio sulfidiphilus TaxID=1033854 RepID=UPI003B31664E